ncbi:intraflagellar transport protein 52 homolog [Cylas formicarius]|uniref:intraflagellar transport protein 52 homolog n=1 Tax=Cylas formicarius TaxID=197179 RepID=UPI002958D639|nr:intraflagellar transport protein 52 homolog [Cylas formicarius]
MAPIADENYEPDTKIIIFNASKQELFQFNENYKSFHRKLKSAAKVVINRDEINSELLKTCSLFILPGSQIIFEDSEIKALINYLETGGRMLICLQEANADDPCNINVLLEHFGITPNIDSLIRTHYYKYFHPKECFIGDAHIISAINRDKLEIKLVYPFGCTMNVMKPSVILFSSGFASFPVDCPLGAVYYNEKTGGRLIAVGSGHMFSDKYLDQENNNKFGEIIIDFLKDSNKVIFLPNDQDDIDISDRNIVPDTAELAEKPKVCLTDVTGSTSYMDYMKLFDHKVYSMNTNLVLETLKLYEELGVKHVQLKIITPKFEAPFPALQPAVFPPSFRELPPPMLELFDLDEAFSSIYSKLAQFTNKYMLSPNIDQNDENLLEMYISTCARIMNSYSANGVKDILFIMGKEIADFKSVDNFNI